MRIVLAVVALAACSTGSTHTTEAPPPPPFTDCRLGSLTGAWHVTFLETNGNCGPIPDETAVFPMGMSAGTGDAGTGCVFATESISADKCQGIFDYTCPLVGVQGTQRWVGSFTQVGAGELRGSQTLTVAETATGCTSTYSTDWVRQ